MIIEIKKKRKQQQEKQFEELILTAYKSEKIDGKWTHPATDLSGEDASVKAIAEAAWTDSVKAKYKTWCESQTTP